MKRTKKIIIGILAVIVVGALIGGSFLPEKAKKCTIKEYCELDSDCYCSCASVDTLYSSRYEEVCGIESRMLACFFDSCFPKKLNFTERCMNNTCVWVAKQTLSNSQIKCLGTCRCMEECNKEGPLYIIPAESGSLECSVNSINKTCCCSGV